MNAEFAIVEVHLHEDGLDQAAAREALDDVMQIVAVNEHSARHFEVFGWVVEPIPRRADEVHEVARRVFEALQWKAVISVRVLNESVPPQSFDGDTARAELPNPLEVIARAAAQEDAPRQQSLRVEIDDDGEETLYF